MALPTLPPFQLSTGPQVTDGRFQTSVAPVFGGDFFGRAQGQGIDLTTLALIAGGAGLVWLVATKRIKF